jgi:hypothetical protein
MNSSVVTTTLNFRVSTRWCSSLFNSALLTTGKSFAMSVRRMGLSSHILSASSKHVMTSGRQVNWCSAMPVFLLKLLRYITLMMNSETPRMPWCKMSRRKLHTCVGLQSFSDAANIPRVSVSLPDLL